MVLTTTTKNMTASSTVDATTVSLSFQNFENHVEKWQRAVEFLKKEKSFLIAMLEVSVVSTKKGKAQALISLQQKII